MFFFEFWDFSKSPKDALQDRRECSATHLASRFTIEVHLLTEARKMFLVTHDIYQATQTYYVCEHVVYTKHIFWEWEEMHNIFRGSFEGLLLGTVCHRTIAQDDDIIQGLATILGAMVPWSSHLRHPNRGKYMA